ncbi:hypothetical protein LTR35_010615 [Friedmanniomyces endolithicus]|uniref:Uncharacterized protein n=1 Tax=Friedmanniomyces endolithicus TaxID=329885 RepID=A0AAN6JBW2_9PEZI|nr:hypothetical protein LTR35_010615 [Friedmanniomyces endolithicus]KAK0300958.1 hypothetical protein LTS00_000105 [Friedmanniomyces endolithicus]KAK0318764.1 hypothetical protein LTR82_010185 [Friedmanniomyces endolithicus]KAK1018965.1 hypothetical protein LTR54_000778 [Friedmanniomyces endolithicus]
MTDTVAEPESARLEPQDSGDEEASQDYHTEASEASASPSPGPATALLHAPTAPESEEDNADPSPTEAGPYLPAHLLKTLLPSSPQVQPTLGKDLSRKQKKGQRRTNRQLKKRQWDQLRADAQANGVLEAGQAGGAEGERSGAERTGGEEEEGVGGGFGAGEDVGGEEEGEGRWFDWVAKQEEAEDEEFRLRKGSKKKSTGRE